MKIGGATLSADLRRIEAVLQVVGEGWNLAVDANGRFDLTAAIEYAKALQPYGLYWYEEPRDPPDFQLQETLAEHYPRPMATGENPVSMPYARNLIPFRGNGPDVRLPHFDRAPPYCPRRFL